MKHYLRNVFLFAFLFLAAIGLKAANPPSNNSICNAVIPLPGINPNNSNGELNQFFSSTNNVTFNPPRWIGLSH